MRFTYKDFKIELSEDVYEPSDDTYLLADALKIKKDSKVLEIGTGTGIIAMIASKTAKQVTAIDINPEAVALAKQNVKINNIQNISVIQSDLFNNIKDSFDTIIFNTPYLPQTEDQHIESPINHAWDGGPDGRTVIDRFLNDFKKHLNKNGTLYLVESTLSSYNKTLEFLKKNDFDTKVIAKKNLFFETIVVIKAKSK
ncbi:MAG: methyltransferase [DPANN group archaeon]|nr:methyltransferase [DPANN group archaeon]